MRKKVTPLTQWLWQTRKLHDCNSVSRWKESSVQKLHCQFDLTSNKRVIAFMFGRCPKRKNEWQWTCARMWCEKGWSRQLTVKRRLTVSVSVRLMTKVKNTQKISSEIDGRDYQGLFVGLYIGTSRLSFILAGDTLIRHWKTYVPVGISCFNRTAFLYYSMICHNCKQ